MGRQSFGDILLLPGIPFVVQDLVSIFFRFALISLRLEYDCSQEDASYCSRPTRLCNVHLHLCSMFLSNCSISAQSLRETAVSLVHSIPIVSSQVFFISDLHTHGSLCRWTSLGGPHTIQHRVILIAPGVPLGTRIFA